MERRTLNNGISNSVALNFERIVFILFSLFKVPRSMFYCSTFKEFKECRRQSAVSRILSIVC